jgi:nucleosome binding factor SPN SPT16 subunit
VIIAQLFQNLGGSKDEITLNLLTKARGNESDDHFGTIIESLKKSGNGKSVGMIVKEKQIGPFADDFMGQLNKAEPDLKIEDATPAISDLLAVKDAKEQSRTKTAAEISAAVLNQVTIAEIEDIIEKEKTVSHQAIADKTEDVLSKPEKLKKIIPAGSKISLEDIESCYTPILMSGGKFDLRPSAQSDSSPLHHQGAVIIALGARYESYCANIARTLLIDSSQDQEKAYKVLTRVHQACIQAMKVGAKVSDVYRTAIKYLRSKAPEYEANFVKNCGFGVCFEFICFS